MAELRYSFHWIIDGLQRREAIRQQLIERGVSLSPKVAWGVRGCDSDI